MGIKKEDEMKNKNLLITGAATRVGKAIAIHFAKRGSNIGLHYFRSSTKAQKLKKDYFSYGFDAFL